MWRILVSTLAVAQKDWDSWCLLNLISGPLICYVAVTCCLSLNISSFFPLQNIHTCCFLVWTTCPSFHMADIFSFKIKLTTSLPRALPWLFFLYLSSVLFSSYELSLFKRVHYLVTHLCIISKLERKFQKEGSYVSSSLVCYSTWDCVSLWVCTQKIKGKI